MGISVIEIKTIQIPNIRYNTYELFRKTGFFSDSSCYIRSKDRYNSSSEEKKCSMDNWNAISKEIDLMNWFFNTGISKTDFEYMKSEGFRKIEKPYLGKSIMEIDNLQFSPNFSIVKKHWALELWKWYSNNYKLTAIGVFKTMGDRPVELYIDRNELKPSRNTQLSDYGLYTSSPQAYQWEWPEKYGLIR